MRDERYAGDGRARIFGRSDIESGYLDGFWGFCGKFRPNIHSRSIGVRISTLVRWARALRPIRWHRLQFAAEPRPHMGILSRIRLDSPPLGRQRRPHMPTTSTDPRAAAAALLVPGTTCHGFAVERRETVPELDSDAYVLRHTALKTTPKNWNFLLALRRRRPIPPVCSIFLSTRCCVGRPSSPSRSRLST